MGTIVVSYDRDHGWIVEAPNHGEMEFYEGIIFQRGRGTVDEGHYTFKDAVMLGREAAVKLRVPCEVYTMNGTFLRIYWPAA